MDKLTKLSFSLVCYIHDFSVFFIVILKRLQNSRGPKKQIWQIVLRQWVMNIPSSTHEPRAHISIVWSTCTSWRGAKLWFRHTVFLSLLSSATYRRLPLLSSQLSTALWSASVHIKQDLGRFSWTSKQHYTRCYPPRGDVPIHRSFAKSSCCLGAFWDKFTIPVSNEYMQFLATSILI